MKIIKTFESFNSTENKKVWIYLDDLRTPKDPTWVVVRNFQEFKDEVEKHNLDDIERISFDHDLADFYYDEDGEKLENTGKTAIDWFIRKHMDDRESGKIDGKYFPIVTVHSDNPRGVQNIIGLVNPYLEFLSGETGQDYIMAKAEKPAFDFPEEF
jgi:hypothetical protein